MRKENNEILIAVATIFGIEQKQRVPIRILMPVASGTGAIEKKKSHGGELGMGIGLGKERISADLQ